MVWPHERNGEEFASKLIGVKCVDQVRGGSIVRTNFRT